MASVIPLSPVNAQYVTVNLANQPVGLVVTQRSTGLFVDIYVNNSILLGGILGRNAVKMIRDLYFGFVGDFEFIDTQATTPTNGLDPYYTGLGSRWVLFYLTSDDLNGQG